MKYFKKVGQIFFWKHVNQINLNSKEFPVCRIMMLIFKATVLIVVRRKGMREWREYLFAISLRAIK